MVFSTCENIGGNHESLRGRLHRNGRIRPIGRLGVTFLIGRLGVKLGKNFDCSLVSSSVGLLNSSSCNRSPKQLFRHNLGSKAKNFNEDRYFCKIRMSQIRLAP